MYPLTLMYPLTFGRRIAAVVSLLFLLALGVNVSAQTSDGKLRSPAHQLASEAYKAFASGDYISAGDLARRAVALEPTNGDYLLLLADSSANTGDMEMTRSALTRYSSLPATIASPPSLDVAYRAIRAHDDDLALRYFAEARERGELTPVAALDAAYAARRQYRDADTLDWLDRYLTMDNGASQLDPEQQKNARALQNRMTQRWHGQHYMYGGPAGWGVGGVSPSGQRNMIQTGVELSYSPNIHLLRTDGGIAFFGRYFMTLYDADGAATGRETGQPALGVRWRPMRDKNLVLEYARYFELGEATRDDNMFRVAYSTGSDPDGSTAWKLFAEANHFVDSEQTMGTFYLSYGWNIFYGANSNPISLNIALISTYDSSMDQPDATSIAPEISHRFSLNERWGTNFDLTLQYRIPIAGDMERARGPAVITAFSF